jgi:hypothetical protein
MYKFSRCNVIVFTIFPFHLLIFDKNRSVSGTNRSEIARRFYEKTGRFIGETSFTVPLLSPVRFNQIFSDFHRFLPNFLKTDD